MKQKPKNFRAAVTKFLLGKINDEAIDATGFGDDFGELPLIAYLAVAIPMGESSSLKPVSAKIINEFSGDYPILAEVSEYESEEDMHNSPEYRTKLGAQLKGKTPDQSPTEIYDDWLSEQTSVVEKRKFNDEKFFSKYWVLVNILNNVRETGKIEGNQTFPSQEIAMERKRRLEDFLVNDAERIFDGLIFSCKHTISDLKSIISDFEKNKPELNLPDEIPDASPLDSEKLEEIKRTLSKIPEECRESIKIQQARIPLLESLKSQFKDIVQLYKAGHQR